MVDDDSDVLFSMMTALESNGFVVDSYSSPDIALEKFKPYYYDLLLLDVRMPGMTGFESLRGDQQNGCEGTRDIHYCI